MSLREPKRALELHDLREGEPYYIAVFLVGAYQEILGDLHNLFGDTHVVHIKLHDEGGWWIEETVKGDTASEVLKYMSYDVDRLYPQFARDCERARPGASAGPTSPTWPSPAIGCERAPIDAPERRPAHG